MKRLEYKNKKGGGIIIYIIIILAALIASKYLLHFDIIEWIKSPTVQKYIQLVWNWIKLAYNWLDTTISKYLKK